MLVIENPDKPNEEVFFDKDGKAVGSRNFKEDGSSTYENVLDEDERIQHEEMFAEFNLV